jgi:light-regulated signal transduction histidine kinase (bacteriophytochrome)
VPSHPAFGQADLTNCERELIHLAGSIQPHGIFLAVEEQQFHILQTSANAHAVVQRDAQALLGQPVASLGGDLEATLRDLARSGPLNAPVPLRCTLEAGGGLREFEGTVHRVDGGVLLVEVEPFLVPERISLGAGQLLSHVDTSVQLFSAASTIGVLADAIVRRFRDLIGYDRVMVYRFDPDGHGKIIAEARNPRLDSLLGHHYPATDIPQRARELYMRTRLRVLVDVHYEAAALVPRRLPGSDDELDMSLCHLRSMSPLHLQYLKNMGVKATLVVSLVREGRLWGLIACHHYSPRNLAFGVRTAAELLAEVITTRISAIENYAHAQVAIQVRRLEQRLIEATSTEGDWRLALFRNPHTLLKPVDATGAVLFFEDDIQTSGEVPSTPELRALLQWVHGQDHDGLFSCSAVARANPALESLTPTASGVLAVRLSSACPDYLMWFRKEQLLTVTWAGDPTKPVSGNDPLELSPRRSFAAWSEIVQGTALPWSSGETALARAFGASLVDIILQVNAVRLLIAEHQLSQTRAAVAKSREPVIILDASLRILFANDAFYQLARRPRDTRPTLDAIASHFSEPSQVHAMLDSLAQERRAWRGELGIAMEDGAALQVGVRAEVVPARDGSVLGFFLIFDDLTQSLRAAAARRQLEQSLSDARRSSLALDAQGGATSATDGVMAAVLANTSIAAMDISDGGAGPSVAGMLEEIDQSAQRAAALYGQLRVFNSP